MIRAALVALLLCSCGPGLAPGYRTLTLGARMGGQVEMQLGAACKARRLKCEEGHPAPDMLTACELPCLRALRTWSRARASYNAAAELTWGYLEVARATRKGGTDWITKLRPGVCSMLRAVGELRPVLGTTVDGWISSLTAASGLVCGGAP